MSIPLKVLVGNVVDDGFHDIDGWFGESFFWELAKVTFFSLMFLAKDKKWSNTVC